MGSASNGGLERLRLAGPDVLRPLLTFFRWKNEVPLHGVATEQRQVAAEQDPVEGREGAVKLVGMRGDELVHSRMAHDLGRERNPSRLDSFDFSNEKISDRCLLGPRLGPRPSSNSVEMPSRFRGDAAQPNRVAWLRLSGRARQIEASLREASSRGQMLQPWARHRDLTSPTEPPPAPGARMAQPAARRARLDSHSTVTTRPSYAHSSGTLATCASICLLMCDDGRQQLLDATREVLGGGLVGPYAAAAARPGRRCRSPA